MTFTIIYQGTDVKIEKLDVKGRPVHRAVFPNGKELYITKMTVGKKSVWTSVPEGQHELAGEIGKLIEQQNSPEQGGLF